jgi:ubiquinone/menaquinone biosynthesis C-methylase UbiE
MEVTERFSNRVENYRRYRPGYPAAVIQLIRETAGLGPGATVADVGSGTGILTKLLLNAGWEVHAVEPNAPMRQAAEKELGSSPRFHSVETRAESTGLPDGSVDAITCAQAFHWFDRDAA